MCVCTPARVSAFIIFCIFIPLFVLLYDSILYYFIHFDKTFSKIFNHLNIKYLPKISGAITVDDDGQHKINDINKLYPNIDATNLILGTRNFKEKNISFKKKIGNWFISHITSPH